ncbi:ERF family protein [Clostridium perfringens]|nr:ERF family protein [Clostridium perfringens]
MDLVKIANKIADNVQERLSNLTVDKSLNVLIEDKTDFVIAGKVKYTWINADEPTEREECSFDIFGQQDDISKAYGSGLTYSERYFILKSLQAPTDNDDPDSKDTRGKTSSSQNQNSNKVYKCTSCGKDVPYNVANFSHKKYQKVLCMDCQKKV